MMLRRAVGSLLAALSLAFGVGISQDASAAEQVLKLGTLAPSSSPWGQVFRVWEKAVKEKSGGRIELQFFYNGQQGDEGAMVAKIKSGQLDGAAVTSVGLSKIHKPILAVQLPGLWRSWAQLDGARDNLKSEFEKGASDAGFFIGGWGDVGQVRLMSKGFAVKAPEDLRGTKPYMWREDSISPVLYQVIGGVTPVPLNVPEVLPNLNTGAVNVVISPSLAAEQLQWASKLDHINGDSSGYMIGAMVFSSKRLDSLPADLRAIVTDTGKVTSAALTARIRNEDAAAFGRMKGKMTVVDVSVDDVAKWAGIFKQVRARLAQGTFAPDLVSRIEGFAK